ncbi:MAG: molybdopterin-guanine dinucleotide biosynthesis protein MobA, partial [Phototrophicales bacterium]
VACDMPFLNVHLLKTLIDLRLNHDAVVPNALGKLHPLHAVYSKTCLPVIRQQIEQEQLRIIDIFSKLSVRYLEEPQLRQIDPQLFSLLNLNRPQDIQSAFEEGALLPPE